jgi:phenylpropionate dioxygenase-like ring-hydroxylating dioxygenase large terminal subunit
LPISGGLLDRYRDGSSEMNHLVPVPEANEIRSIVKSLKEYSKLTIEEIRTLDPVLYYSPAMFALEIEHVWTKEWILAGHVSQVRKPGDFFAFDLLSEPMIVVRGKDNQIRAISSVCQHRFMPVVRHNEKGNAKRFVCPYHLWSYGLDGKLIGATYMAEHKCFNVKDVAMPEYRVEIWNDLIFVNLDDEAAPLAPRLKGCEERMSVFKAPEDYVAVYHHDEVWDANWKFVVENNENYHSVAIHPKTVQISSPTEKYRADLANDGDGYCSAFWGAGDKRPQAGRPVPGYKGENVLELCTVFPMGTLSVMPDSLSIYPYWPVSVDKTRIRACAIVHPGDVVKEWEEDHSKSFIARFLAEDYSALGGGINWAVKSKKLKAGMCSNQEEMVLRVHQHTAKMILEAIG